MRVLSFTESDSTNVCRMQLDSGERIMVKVMPNTPQFIGVWEIASMNPFTIAADWLMSLVTGRRTAGLIQVWGLGAEALDTPSSWTAMVEAMFPSPGNPASILGLASTKLASCPDLEAVNQYLLSREMAARVLLEIPTNASH